MRPERRPLPPEERAARIKAELDIEIANHAKLQMWRLGRIPVAIAWGAAGGLIGYFFIEWGPRLVLACAAGLLAAAAGIGLLWLATRPKMARSEDVLGPEL